MCRWIAYSGSPIYLEQLMVRPEHSLIEQSREAQMAKTAINADGFGIGWYSERRDPGIFRDVYPAWNDCNLMNVCQHIQSHLFFGHVRASTGSAINRANCHPFRYHDRLFMHNGQIGGFEQIRRDLSMAIRPDLYSLLEGTTDSEILFYLAIGHGLMDEPQVALEKTVKQIEDVMAAHAIKKPFRITAAFSDGQTMYAVRYSNDNHPPSLYYGTGVDTGMNNDQACIILSEPLEEGNGTWTAVPPSSFLTASDGQIVVQPFAQ
jgi:predicted glutamine amidotransferase